MATSFVFNPFTSNFDQISTITLAAVGSTPNANGATLTGQVLNLQPADSTNPGVVTATGDQFFGGNKYISYIQSGGTTLTQARIGSTATMVAVGTFLSSVSYIGSSPTICGYKANGTEAAPTAVIANQILFAMSGRGHDGTSFVLATKGRFSVNSAENWTPTAQGTYLQFLTTPKLGTTAFERMRIFDDGNVSIGNTASTAKLSITGNITASTTITATGNMSAANLSGTNTGDVTLAAVGAVPNANAATLAGQVLNLQPADTSFPGVVTTGTQSFAGAKTFTGAISASNLSGTNTGDQTITLTSDVTGSGTGSFATTIANNVVTNAKLAQMATMTIKGNDTGGAADPQDLTVTEVNTMLGTVVNPMTTIGDIIQATTSGVPVRLPRGTANQVLQTQGSSTSVSWQGINQNNFPNYIAVNPNFEVDTTGWATYADAAATTPVNGTGGSPVVTFTRSTSAPLRGSASGLLTKDAANRQGEGFSYDFTIDAADVSRTLTIQADLLASAAFVVGDASDVTVWIYDVTNSVLITPNPYTINSAASTFVSTFQSTTSTSYRLIFHISTTNAAAWTLQIDNVIVSASETVFAAVMSPWQSNLTFTLNNFGTLANQVSEYRIEGDSIRVRITTTVGTLSGSTASCTLPLTIDSAKMPANSSGTAIGTFWCSGGATNPWSAVNSFGPIFYDGSDTANVYFANQQTTTGLLKANGNQVGFNSGQMTLEFSIPIAGLQSSVASANGRVFNISSVIANGTRVTAIPTLLGQYRTLIKDASALTASDDAPSTGPSVANGMQVFAVNYATAGTSGQPNRWEIFVGKNKVVKPQFFSTTGMTGNMSGDLFISGSDANTYGTEFSYDPTTGVAVVDCIFQSSSTTNRQGGFSIPSGGGAMSNVTNPYFDLLVSENALAVTSEAFSPSEVLLTGGSGFGSTNTSVRRFTTLSSSTGASLTATQSSTLGDSVTALYTGVYAITLTDYTTTSAGYIIVARNSTSTSVTHPNRLSQFYCDTLTSVTIGVTLALTAGDVIRCMATNTTSPPTSADLVYFRIVRIN